MYITVTIKFGYRVQGTRAKSVYVRTHWRLRNGKKYFVKAHWRRIRR